MVGSRVVVVNGRCRFGRGRVCRGRRGRVCGALGVGGAILGRALVESLEARRHPCESGGAGILVDVDGAVVAGGEGSFHGCGKAGLFVLAVGMCPFDAEDLARDVDDAVFGDAGPEHCGAGADVFGEVDVEACDGGLEFRPGVVLEGELGLEGAGDGGGEEGLLLLARELPEGGEASVVAVGLNPLEGQVGAVCQHGFAAAPVGEFVVVDPGGRPVGGLAEGDVERVVVVDVALGEERADELEDGEVEGRVEVVGEVGFDQSGPDAAQVVGEADADSGFLAGLGLRVGRGLMHGGAGNGGGSVARG